MWTTMVRCRGCAGEVGLATELRISRDVASRFEGGSLGQGPGEEHSCRDLGGAVPRGRGWRSQRQSGARWGWPGPCLPVGQVGGQPPSGPGAEGGQAGADFELVALAR